MSFTSLLWRESSRWGRASLTWTRLTAKPERGRRPMKVCLIYIFFKCEKLMGRLILYFWVFFIFIKSRSPIFAKNKMKYMTVFLVDRLENWSSAVFTILKQKCHNYLIPTPQIWGRALFLCCVCSWNVVITDAIICEGCYLTRVPYLQVEIPPRTKLRRRPKPSR